MIDDCRLTRLSLQHPDIKAPGRSNANKNLAKGGPAQSTPYFAVGVSLSSVAVWLFWCPGALLLNHALRASNLNIALSHCLINEALKVGSALAAHFAACRPKTGFIQAYFQCKRGSSRRP